jgi:hypothetical protein
MPNRHSCAAESIDASACPVSLALLCSLLDELRLAGSDPHIAHSWGRLPSFAHLAKKIGEKMTGQKA